MATLLLRLVGPMQSWGTRSRFDERDTELEPSKSGVIGLLCAALGRDRVEPVADLAQLRMAARVDREGVRRYDYQTVRGVVRADGSGYSNVQSWRHFLADAAFLAGLEGERALLDALQAALEDPVWPLYLGRKSYVPSLPVALPDGVRDEPLLDALRRFPPVADPARGQEARRVLVEASDGALRMDVPTSFSRRTYSSRFVRTELWPLNGGD